MANPTNRQLWEMGVPLDGAWLELASDDAKRRHSELPTLAKFNEQAKATKPQSALELLKVYDSGVRQWSQRGEFENELREALLVELFNDQLHAYAYRMAPSRSRAPVRIAAELFDLQDPDWRSESLSARGVEYAEIRVIDPACAPNFQKQAKGRKGSASTIRKAINALQSEGFDLCGIDRKLACEVIRSKIGHIKANQNGLSNENLTKYVLEICPKRGIDN